MPPAPLSRILQIEAASLVGDEGFAWVCSPVSIPIASETAGLCGIQVACPKGVEFSKSGLSRLSVGFSYFKGDNGQATSPRVDLEIYALSGGVGLLVASVDLPPFAWSGSGRGLVCGVSGVLAEGFEVRARVEPGIAGAVEIMTRVRLVVDRGAGDPGVWVVNGGAAVGGVTFTGF